VRERSDAPVLLSDTSIHCAAVEFEKWQALGNDYVIVEEEALPFELTPARICAICASGTGVCSDGILLLSRTTQPGTLAQLRVFNPDGSEAEVSGNGAREAVLYMRRTGWATDDVFTINTAAGELRPRITSSTTCTVQMGRARVRSADYPSGPEDGTGALSAGGREWRFQHVQVGNPQCSIRVADEAELASLDLGSLGPQIERNELFPNRTNVSWFATLAPERIRVRVFERGAGETSSSGTGAIGAAVTHVLHGGRSPVAVMLDGGQLEVEVGEELDVILTGSAAPVYRGALADEFITELDAL
jgi:diaminopimelate epimerase